MNIENSYGFRSAQAAWENANPFDSECTCAEDVLFVCDECGQISSARQPCPEMDCSNTDFMRAMTPHEVTEYYPADDCPQHGYTDEDAADDAREHDREARLGY